MAKQFHLDIITPTHTKSFNKVDYLRIPSIDGLIGVQAKHTAAIIGLSIGEMRITQDGKDYFYAISGGFADITNESVQLLLETAEDVLTLDQTRATESLQRAKKRLNNANNDLDRARASMKRAQNRLRILTVYSHKK